mmetsp:Transcript_36846/g.93109  ORF Transcript_36846/g.93109 Transcript_36846/m.93109 type:complete len:368 (+) Transcript_36846:30-1133(+)
MKQSTAGRRQEGGARPVTGTEGSSGLEAKVGGAHDLQLCVRVVRVGLLVLVKVGAQVVHVRRVPLGHVLAARLLDARQPQRLADNGDELGVVPGEPEAPLAEKDDPGQLVLVGGQAQRHRAQPCPERPLLTKGVCGVNGRAVLQRVLDPALAVLEVGAVCVALVAGGLLKAAGHERHVFARSQFAEQHLLRPRQEVEPRKQVAEEADAEEAAADEERGVRLAHGGVRVAVEQVAAGENAVHVEGEDRAAVGLGHLIDVQNEALLLEVGVGVNVVGRHRVQPRPAGGGVQAPEADIAQQDGQQGVVAGPGAREREERQELREDPHGEEEAKAQEAACCGALRPVAADRHAGPAPPLATGHAHSERSEG